MRRLAVLFAVALTAPACDGGDELLTREELLDPETCESCHPQHYREWKSSMHAYAADDPVFLAMNRRGQEETGGELGDFCVGCHAPMAVREGLTTDGLNLDEIEQKYKGVTCYFCHTVEDVTGDHNNPLLLASDDILRGGISDPVKNGAHRMAYSPLHDRTNRRSSELCGACHDIVTPAGVHLERTFAEWKESLFASDDPLTRLTCSQCHMKGDLPGVVADFPDVPLRFPKEHSFPGIDIAVTPWPDVELQLEQIARELDPMLNPKLCVTPVDGGEIEYNLDNVGGGHMFPSGAAQDRRAWAEIVAYRGDTVVYSSGVVQPGEPVASVAATDPDLWQMRDFTTDENGDEAHMFWEVAEVESELLPPIVTLDRTDPAVNHSVSRFFSVAGLDPDRVTARVHIRPMGLDVIDDLIDSGHLAPAIRDQIITHTLVGTELEWTSERGFGCVCRNGPC